VQDDTADGALWLLAAIQQGLAAQTGEGVARVLARLGEQGAARLTFAPPPPRAQPACRHLPQAIAETAMLNADLAAALAAVEDRLCWQRTEGYSDALLGDGFMANYAHCQIVGPSGFFPGNDFLLGLLLLGPGLHYRDHYHPAPELYWALTGPSEWKRGAGGFSLREAGDTIWHRPFVVHSTITLQTPLLAVWCWTEDTAVAAQLCSR
jgi:hypothetical protein